MYIYIWYIQYRVHTILCFRAYACVIDNRRRERGAAAAATVNCPIDKVHCVHACTPAQRRRRRRQSSATHHARQDNDNDAIRGSLAFAKHRSSGTCKYFGRERTTQRCTLNSGGGTPHQEKLVYMVPNVGGQYLGAARRLMPSAGVRFIRYINSLVVQ